MRVSKLEVSGFRGFPISTELDLNADVVILFGPNGTGKTSLMDAILWCICGKISRFEKVETPISKYSRDGVARVSIELSSQASSFTITRTVGKSKSEELLLKYQDEVFVGEHATSKIADILFQATDIMDSVAELSNIFTRSLYLQQDLIREFIESDKPYERFLLLSDLAGVGTILNLQKNLESGRKEWRKSIKLKRLEERDPALNNLSDLLPNFLPFSGRVI